MLAVYGMVSPAFSQIHTPYEIIVVLLMTEIRAGKIYKTLVQQSRTPLSHEVQHLSTMEKFLAVLFEALYITFITLFSKELDFHIMNQNNNKNHKRNK
jgi:2-hydroxy-3-keto-5-methylthiopentenyl-1-phosphate phosphatase